MLKIDGKTGDTIMTDNLCTAPGCPRKVYAKKLCNLHYNQVRTHGRLTPELERAEYSSDDQECSENGCPGLVIAKGLCRAHYQQQYRMSEYDDQIEADTVKKAEVHTLNTTPPPRRRVVRRRTA